MRSGGCSSLMWQQGIFVVSELFRHFGGCRSSDLLLACLLCFLGGLIIGIFLGACLASQQFRSFIGRCAQILADLLLQDAVLRAPGAEQPAVHLPRPRPRAGPQRRRPLFLPEAGD